MSKLFIRLLKQLPSKAVRKVGSAIKQSSTYGALTKPIKLPRIKDGSEPYEYVERPRPVRVEREKERVYQNRTVVKKPQRREDNTYIDPRPYLESSAKEERERARAAKREKLNNEIDKMSRDFAIGGVSKRQIAEWAKEMRASAKRQKGG